MGGGIITRHRPAQKRMRNERSISPDTKLKSIYPQKFPVRTATALARSVRVPCCRQRKKGIPRRQAADRRQNDNLPADIGQRLRQGAQGASSPLPAKKPPSKHSDAVHYRSGRRSFPERSAVRRDRCSGRPIRHGTDRRLFLTISPPTGKSPSGVILISGGPSDRRSDSGRKAHHSPRHGIQTS